jgi:pyridoxine 5-phosphate synthase
MKLGVNLDHIATLRQQRKEDEPNLVKAALIAQKSGADGITIHLREDRRHIQDNDVYEIRKICKRLNLEMAISPEIINIACKVKPDFCCLVPEKRAELTTEGGLDVLTNAESLKKAIKKLHNAGILVSIFIDPDIAQIEKAKEIKADYIEIHTGKYANAKKVQQKKELATIKSAAKFAKKIGLKVNAGHGLKYYNVGPIAKIKEIEELNIGHSIICRSVFSGLSESIQKMKSLIG